MVVIPIPEKNAIETSNSVSERWKGSSNIGTRDVVTESSSRAS